MERHAHDTYTMSDGTKLRLLNNDILVRVDEAPSQSSGGILFPQGSVDDVNNTGTVVAFGYEKTKKGLRVPIRELEVGLKVVFVRYLENQTTNEHIQERFEEGLIRLQPTDVLVAYTKDDEHLVRG
jgi:co-chaperonin GroES (HSP10)